MNRRINTISEMIMKGVILADIGTDHAFLPIMAVRNGTAVKAYACDNEQLMDLLNNRLQTIPGVVSTETLISLEQSIKREIPVHTEDKVK